MIGGNEFLSRPMSILLDMVRGLAAVIVLVGHAKDLDLYTGPYWLGSYMQHHAVTVFFVLSGLVIAHSVRARHSELLDYALARAARIVPVAWFAIAFSAMLFAWSRMAGLAEGMLPPFDQLSLSTTLLPALFLSESPVGRGLVWNPPFWSLVCEVFFYALFGAALFLRGRVRVLTLGLLACLAGWQVLALMPIWLMGAALARWPDHFRPSLGAGLVLLCAGAGLAGLADFNLLAAVYMLSDVTGLNLKQLGFAKFLLVDFAMGLAVSMAIIGARPLSHRFHQLLHSIEQPVRWFAGMSFTLYLLHHPILLLIRGYGIGAGGSPIVFVALIIFVIGICALLAQLVERQTPQLRNLLQARLREDRLRPQAA